MACRFHFFSIKICKPDLIALSIRDIVITRSHGEANVTPPLWVQSVPQLTEKPPRGIPYKLAPNFLYFLDFLSFVPGSATCQYLDGWRRGWYSVGPHQ
ncbi:hypothetical protein SDJN03_17226, partial [Cucurbita argyrosperma subsp. sororia]